MKAFALLIAAATLAGCAVPTSGVVPRAEGMYTITRQGEGFWVQPGQLTALASQDASKECERANKKFKLVHVKEIPAGPLGRWPESEVLFRCE